MPADVTRVEVLGLAERAWAHSDRTIAELPLDAEDARPGPSGRS